MKKLIIFIVITIAFTHYSKAQVNSCNCNAQDKSAWQTFLTDSIYTGDDKNYIYLNKILIKKSIKNLYYSLKKKKYILAIIDGDSTVEEKAFLLPNLFQIVYDNYYDLFKLKNYLIENGKFHKKFHNELSDSTNIFSQLGIRYGEIHFNHFLKFSMEEIEKTKNKKHKKGMEVINRLYAILEEAEKKL